MSPRIVQMPLSGGDRKAQAKGIRQAHDLHDSKLHETAFIRSAVGEKLREADRLECEAWNAIMWAGGSAMPSPGNPIAESTIAKAMNAGYDLLEVKCNHCRRTSFVALCGIKRRPETPVWKLEEQLRCKPCSDIIGRRQRAHIVRLICANPDPEVNEASRR